MMGVGHWLMLFVGNISASGCSEISIPCGGIFEIVCELDWQDSCAEWLC